MRTKLKDGTIIKLTSGIDGEGISKEITIDRVIGTGASAVVYDAHYYDGAGQIFKCCLKECYPYNAKTDRIGNEIIFDNTEKEKAFAEFKNAYNMQKMFQNDENTGNQTVHLFDLYSGNGTLYSVMDVNFGETFIGKDIPENTERLLQILEVILVLTKIIARYHKKGYLHLDIKPANFLVSYEPSIDIKLFDMDSVIKTDEVRNTKLISYSQDWAAPEQIMGNRSKICPATDLYAIGAILFEKIMGKKVCAEDRGVFAEWDFNFGIFKKENPKLKRLVENIFRKTLAANVKRRYQHADELINALKQVVDIIRKGQPYVLSHFALSDNYFVGRQEELTKIHEAFKKDCRFVFLSGMGGIGKSEIAKNYAKQFEKEHDAILFFQYHNSLKSDVIEKIIIQNCDDSDSDREKALQIALNNNVLLIVDNFDVEEDEYLEELKEEYDCKFLFTTRMHSDDYFSDNDNNLTINVNSLSYDEQKFLFEKEYKKQLSDEEKEIVKSILEETEGNTLLIPLIAKQLNKGTQPFKEFLSSLDNAGVKGVSGNIIRHSKDGKLKGNLYEILCHVLSMSFDNDSYSYIMRCMSLLDGIYIKRKRLEALIGTQYAEDIRELIFRNWINVDGIGTDSVLYTHKVISQICREELKPSTGNCEEFLRSVLSYMREGCATTSERNVKSKFFELIMSRLSGSDEFIIELYLEYMDKFRFREKYFDIIINFFADRYDEKALKTLIKVYCLKINFLLSEDRIKEATAGAANIDVDKFVNDLVSETMSLVDKAKNLTNQLEKYSLSDACEEYYNLGELLFDKVQNGRAFLGEIYFQTINDLSKEIIELFDVATDILKTIDFADDKKMNIYHTMASFYEDDFPRLLKLDFCNQPKKRKMYADLIKSLRSTTRGTKPKRKISTYSISNSKTAIELFSIGDYSSAIEYFEKAIKEDNVNVYAEMAKCYFKWGNKHKAVKTLEDAKKRYMLKYNGKNIYSEINKYIEIAECFIKVELPQKALEQYKWIWNQYYETNVDNEELKQIFINIATNIYILSNDKKEKQHFYESADNIYIGLSDDCRYTSDIGVFIKEKIKKLKKEEEYAQIAYMLMQAISCFNNIGTDEVKVISEGLNIIENNVDDLLFYEVGKKFLVNSSGDLDGYVDFVIRFYERIMTKRLYLKIDIDEFVQSFINIFDKHLMNTTDSQKDSIIELTKKIISIFKPVGKHEKYLEACVYKIWADNCRDRESKRESMQKCNYYLIAEYKGRGLDFEQKFHLWRYAIYQYGLVLHDMYSAELCFRSMFHEWKDCINSDYNSAFIRFLYNLGWYQGYIECLVAQHKMKYARGVLNKIYANCMKLIKGDPRKEKNIYKYFEILATGMGFIKDDINIIFMFGMAMLSRIEKEKILDNCSLPDIDECTIVHCEDILREVLEKEVDAKDKDYIIEYSYRILEIAIMANIGNDKYKTILQLGNQIINKNTYDEYSFK